MIIANRYNTVSLPAYALYAIMMCMLLAAMGIYLGDYIGWRSPVLMLSIVALPFVVYFNRFATPSYRFIYIALALFIVGFRLPEKTVLFFTLAAAIIGLSEALFGKWRLLPLLIALMLWPAAQYVASIVSFPVRMWLTQVAGTLLQVTGQATMAAGNMIVFNGAEYSVDPACMGLKMLVTSLISTLFFTAIIQRHQNKKLPAYYLLASLALTVLLNVITNLFRILLLVYFDVLPAQPMHEVIGLICFLVYTILPAILLLRFVIGRWGTPNTQTSKNSARVIPLKGLLLSALLLLFIFARQTWYLPSTSQAKHLPRVSGYNITLGSDGVVTMTNAQCLVYIKKIASCTHADHNPIACWIGSGYEFDKLQVVKRNGVDVYMGTISKGNEVLHTAWWYDNGTDRTISQWHWRMQMLTGAAAYAVVNITTASPQVLDAKLTDALTNHPFKQIITR